MLKPLTMTRAVYDQLRSTIGSYPAETGGILGSSDAGATIDRFYFDASAHVTDGTYSPDVTVLNRVIKAWNDNGIQFTGFIHSHPNGHHLPSVADIKYANRIMGALK